MANSKHPFPYSTVKQAMEDNFAKCGVPKHEAEAFHLMLLQRGFYQVREHKYQALRKSVILEIAKDDAELQRRADAQLAKELGKVKA